MPLASSTPKRLLLVSVFLPPLTSANTCSTVRGDKTGRARKLGGAIAPNKWAKRRPSWERHVKHTLKGSRPLHDRHTKLALARNPGSWALRLASAISRNFPGLLCTHETLDFGGSCFSTCLHRSAFCTLAAIASGTAKWPEVLLARAGHDRVCRNRKVPVCN